MVPLSKVSESKICLTASGMSAVFSMKQGPLPGPTPRAGLPEEYAARTMASPPVARIMPVSGCFIRVSVDCFEGVSTTWMRWSGAPALRAASCSTLTVARMQFIAPGCGEMTMAFPAFREMSVLYMTVDVGFVLGMSATTTPTGTATSMVLLTGSSARTPMVFISLMESQTIFEPSWFLRTLSSQRPKPVSSLAIFARGSAFAMQAAHIASQMRST